MNSRGEGLGIRGQGVSGRREFVGALGVAALLPVLGRCAPAKLDRIGIQLYTVRREFSRNPEDTLARIAEIGFKEVEFAGYPAGTAPSLRASLDRLGLVAPSGHVSPDAVWQQTLDEAATLGHRYVVVAWIPEERRRTPDDWKRTAASFNLIGEIARKAGIQFCYHNHDFEFAKVGHRIGYDVLLTETDRSLVRFEMDLYWITKAGQDPLAYFAKWPGRFPLVHVKDMDATPRKFFTEVGRGTIDFRRIFAKAGQAGIRHWYYEQDATPGAPLESARISYEYLKNLTF